MKSKSSALDTLSRSNSARIISDAKPLRRRRRIVERAGADLDRERLGDIGLEFFEIGARHRAADLFQIGADLAPDIAAIEILKPGFRQMIERRRERALHHGDAGLRRLAVDQERRGEARRVLHLRRFFFGQPRLAARHGVAGARRRDRGREQKIERQFSAMRFRKLKRELPSRRPRPAP